MNEAVAGIVTGAASGIGRAVALLLATRGSAVALVDVSEPGLAETAAAVAAAGGTAIEIAADVTAEDAVRDAVERTIAELGPLASVVACAASR